MLKQEVNIDSLRFGCLLVGEDKGGMKWSCGISSKREGSKATLPLSLEVHKKSAEQDMNRGSK
jgi:hypothetical protein